MIAAEVANAVHREIVDRLVQGEPMVETSSVVRRHAPLLSGAEMAEIVREVDSMLGGLGPIAALLDDEAVTDVLINGPSDIWVDRGGELVRTAVTLTEAQLAGIVERVVAPLGRRVDRASPFADARLPNGSRVHVVGPPIAIGGPCVTIRRFRTRPVQLSEFGPQAEGLAEAVSLRRNILVSGGTGAGKTTLLNALCSFLEPNERVITIEDAAELSLEIPHVVRLEARPPNAELVGEVNIRDLVRQALRMRPDRLIVGEVRGAEAFDMLQAMNTGHSGSMTTCHANGPEEALWRVEGLVQQAGLDLSIAAVQAQIRAAIDVVVHVVREPDGRRVVGAVHLVDGGR